MLASRGPTRRAPRGLVAESERRPPADLTRLIRKGALGSADGIPCGFSARTEASPLPDSPAEARSLRSRGWRRSKGGPAGTLGPLGGDPPGPPAGCGPGCFGTACPQAQSRQRWRQRGGLRRKLIPEKTPRGLQGPGKQSCTPRRRERRSRGRPSRGPGGGGGGHAGRSRGKAGVCALRLHVLPEPFCRRGPRRLCSYCFSIEALRKGSCPRLVVAMGRG